MVSCAISVIEGYNSAESDQASPGGPTEFRLEFQTAIPSLQPGLRVLASVYIAGPLSGISSQLSARRSANASCSSLFLGPGMWLVPPGRQSMSCRLVRIVNRRSLSKSSIDSSYEAYPDDRFVVHAWESVKRERKAPTSLDASLKSVLPENAISVLRPSDIGYILYDVFAVLDYR